MRIVIEAIDHDKQRYNTLGDWYFCKHTGDLYIMVTGADCFDQDDVFLVALHELIEAKLCTKAGITQGEVDAFDTAFTGQGEPGDSPDAPYRKQHRCAMLVEHMAALLMGKFDYGVIE